MMKMITQIMKGRLRRLEALIPPMNLRNLHFNLRNHRCVAWIVGPAQRRGQSVVEYLVVTAAIIAIIISTVAPLIAARSQTLMSTAIGNIGR